ncbi:MAG: amidohydrolase [Desulfobacterales bacterium]|nr:amidohydrolase [Desulfobacterales bacterium]
MIIDTHVHIFPDSVKQDRSVFFENEPEFRLLYDSPRSAINTVDEVLISMDKHGVDISVVCGFPWRNPEYTQKNNDVIIESVHAHPDRIRGLACFDVTWEGAADETQRCLDAGLSGAGELAFYLTGIDQSALSALAPVMAVLKENGNRPCMIHTNEPVGHSYPGKTPITMEQIYGLAKAFPENRIILAHWGGGLFFYNIMKKEAKSVLKNIWYDTAASPFLYDPVIYDLAAGAGVIDKVLLGTDYPLLPPERYYKELDRTDLSEAQKKQVLGENAWKLFAAI